MAKIVNITPHDLTIIAKGNQIVISSSGIARVKQENVLEGAINIDGINVPICKTKMGDIEGLPEQQEGVFFFVSKPVFDEAIKLGRTDVLCNAEVVRNDKGQTIGTKMFTIG